LHVNADFHWCPVTGKRFEKDVIESRLYRMISYLRGRGRPRTYLRPPDPYDATAARVIAAYLIKAITEGEWTIIREVVQLGQLHDDTGGRNKYTNWPYYAAIVALRFLDQGILPTRTQVKNEIIRERVLAELLMSPARSETGSALVPALINLKRDEVLSRCPRNWARIFRSLNLGDLKP
jgi:hypothetical protein